MYKALMVCYVSSEVGFGHLSRLLSLADVFYKDNKIHPEFLIFGNHLNKNELNRYNTHYACQKKNSAKIINDLLEKNNFDAIIFDIHKKNTIVDLKKLLKRCKKNNVSIVSIDNLIEYRDIIDIIWVPSFNFDSSKYGDTNCIIKSGWDSFLIQKRCKNIRWSPGSKILLLTGGSDTSNLGKTLPSLIDKLLERNYEINWVRGPFAEKPKLPKSPKLNWIIHDAPNNLDELIINNNYVMTVFGVSFFEVLQYGIPSVVFSPYGDKDNAELKALSKEGVAKVAYSLNSAINGIFELTNNHELSKEYSVNALKKMSINGSKNLSDTIYNLICTK